MRILVYILVLVGIAVRGWAGEPLICTDPGTVMEFGRYDRGGNLTGYITSTVRDVLPRDDHRVVTIINHAFDAQRQPVKNEVRVVTVLVFEDRMVVMPDGLFPQRDLSAQGAFIVYDGDKIEIPYRMVPGEKFPDYDLTMTMKRTGAAEQPAKETRLAVIRGTHREALTGQTVETPAGSYDCCRMRETVSMTMLMGLLKLTTQNVIWFAPRVGRVRSEEWDKRGQLESRTELLSIRKP